MTSLALVFLSLSTAGADKAGIRVLAVPQGTTQARFSAALNDQAGLSLRFFEAVDKSTFELDGKRVQLERRKPNLLRVADCDVKSGSKGFLEVILRSGMKVRFDVSFAKYEDADFFLDVVNESK